MKYPNAAKGIKKIFVAEILSIVAAVLLLAIVIMMATSNVDTSMSGEAVTQALETAKVGAPFAILSIAMMVFMLASYVLNFIGIATASKDEAGFKRALWMLLESLACGIGADVLENTHARVADWLKVPSTLFELVVTIYVLEGIGSLARNLDNKQIADMSAQARTWLMCALVLASAAQVFVALGTAGSVLNTTSGIAAALLQLVAYVVYLRVLNKARQMQ